MGYPGYFPLFNRSNYSFLEGASHPQELVREVARLGLPGLALTDRDGVYGVVQAHEEAKRLGVKLIVGAQITVDDGSTIVLLAKTEAGYANLCGLITCGRRRSKKGESQVSWPEVCAHAEGLIALWGGRESLLIARERPDEVAELLLAAFEDRIYALLPHHFTAKEEALRPLILARAERYGLLPVAAVEVLYHDQKRRPLQDVLTCIRHGVTLDEASPLLRPNAEHGLLSAEDFAARFAELPGAISRTLEIAARCTFSMARLQYRYPQGELPPGYSAAQWLREQTFRGAKKRYGEQIPKDAREQLQKELSLIEELDYCGYFLTMKEIVDFCREEEILCQGRGSAANSVVCYCLGITAIDPVQMDLLFERFISRERAEPPDIDLDIAHERREEVIQHVYEKYGRDRAAMVANIIRYRPKSAVRDVGKALGLSPVAVDKLARLLSRSSGLSEELWEQAGLDPTAERHVYLQALTEELLDFPRHLSIHPGGFLLTDGPISDLVPVENAAMEGRTVIQWDKYDVEALGLFKVDLLGLGALTMLDKAFRLLRKHKNIDLDMARLPADDEATYDMICKAETLGTFQIESRAQMAMLPRLRPRRYYDLVIQISIIRPGPITGDMVHPYLKRRRGEEPVEYAHPALIPVLKKTLGVPLFQEQVMRLAVVAADYSAGEADQLRRDMAAWRRDGLLEHHRHRLISRMTKKGIDQDFAERIFHQILGFADYGFPESHAASFALIAYATAYLRCHYPVIFTCALLNAQPMGFYSPSTIVGDARRRGIEIRAVDINFSSGDCTLEPVDGGPYEHGLRMGLRYIKSLRAQEIEQIVEARVGGVFVDLPDFMTRTGLSRSTARRLIEAGALESLGLTRRQALWQLQGWHATAQLPMSLPLREAEEALMPHFRELSRLEAIHWDYRTSYHSPRGHLLGPLRPWMNKQGWPTAAALRELPDGQWVHFAALVICRQRPATAAGVLFMTLEDETGLANLVIFPAIYERYPVLAKAQAFLGVSGRVQNQEGTSHLLAEYLWAPALKGVSQGAVASRDFR